MPAPKRHAWPFGPSLWSIVSEIRSTLDFDSVGCTEEDLSRFDHAFEFFQGLRRDLSPSIDTLGVEAGSSLTHKRV